MEMHTVRSDLTDISAEKEALEPTTSACSDFGWNVKLDIGVSPWSDAHYLFTIN